MVKYETIEQLEKEGYTNSFNKEVWTKHINDDEGIIIELLKRIGIVLLIGMRYFPLLIR